jgi:hypothetical protein
MAIRLMFLNTSFTGTEIDVVNDMTSLVMNDQIGFSRRSIDGLVEIVSTLRKDIDLPAGSNLRIETARAVKAIFDNLAWADGQLDSEEIQHLNLLLDTHQWLKNAYVQIERTDLRSTGVNNIPNLLCIAMDYDERNNSHLAQMLVNTLEMIAYGVIASDGGGTPEELQVFRSHVSAMRRFVSIKH